MIYRSPLTEIGVNVKVGDYVLAINGHDLTGADDPYRLLRNAADSPVNCSSTTSRKRMARAPSLTARSPMKPS